MALNVQESYKLYGAQLLNASATSNLRASSSMLSSLTNENELTDVNIEEDVQPTALETKQIEDAKEVVEGLEKVIEECLDLIEKFQTQQEEFQNEFEKLTAEYEAEEDPDKKANIMNEIDSVQESILGVISQIGNLYSQLKEHNTTKEKAVENYNQTVETVNTSLKQRSEQAKLISQMESSSVDPMPFGNAANIPNVNAGDYEKYGYNAERGKQFAAAALQTTQQMAGSRGYCYRGVIRSLAKMGITGLTGGSAYMAADQLAKRSDFTEVKVSKADLKNLPAGAVVVWNRTADNSKPHGHISISLGDGREASDHLTNQYQSCGDGTFRVFLPK